MHLAKVMYLCLSVLRPTCVSGLDLCVRRECTEGRAEELQLYIFGFLSPFQVLKIQSVCRDWKRLIDDPALWKRLSPLSLFLCLSLCCANARSYRALKLSQPNT